MVQFDGSRAEIDRSELECLETKPIEAAYRYLLECDFQCQKLRSGRNRQQVFESVASVEASCKVGAVQIGSFNFNQAHKQLETRAGVLSGCRHVVRYKAFENGG